MKKLATLLLLITYHSVICQSSNAFRNKINHVFQQVDLNQVPNGLLQEYGAEMTHLNHWEGTLTSENFGTLPILRQVYGSVLSMQTTTGMGLTSLSTINQRVESYEQSNEVILTAIHMNYYRLKDNTLSNNLMYVSNGQLYDTPNRLTIPYQKESAMVFATLDERYETHGSVPFKLPSNLFIRNTPETIQNIRIDFGNGQGYQTVSLNSVKHINYTQSGEYTLKIRVRYTNGTNYYAQTKIHIMVNPLLFDPNDQCNLYDGYPNEEFPLVGHAYQGLSATGLVSIEYGQDPDGKCTLDRPLIIAEGYDINSVIKGNSETQFDYLDFVTNPTVGGIDAEVGNNQTLRQALYNRGYDLVFLNYDDVTAPIQRNAYLLEKVIEWVNDNKDADAAPNVVLGQSMGGPLARYALRHMEQTGRTHDTRLYVSFDGPHQGANIPLSMQAAVHHLVNSTLKYGKVSISLSDIAPELQNLYDGLNTPAAKQMLIYNLKGTGTNISLNSTEHDAFYNELHGMGMPSQGGIRNISIANGSECGTDQGFDPYAISVDFSANVDIPNLIGILIGFGASPGIGLESIFATDTDINTNLTLRMLPDHESKMIYSGSMTIKKKILFGLFNFTRHLIPPFNFTTPSNILPLDNAGGGVRDFEDEISELIPGGLEGSFQELRFNFLPTYSTLDIGSGNIPITNAEVYGDYSPANPPTGNKASSFDSFYTNDDNNEVHLNVNPGNGKYLLAELDQINASCYGACGLAEFNIVTSGPSQLCQNQQANFTLNNIPPGTTVTWNTWSGLNIISGQNTATLKAKANTIDGKGWVQATLTTACEEFKLDKFYYSQSEPTWEPYIQLENGAEGESWYFCSSHYGNVYTLDPINDLDSHKVRIKNLYGNVLWTSYTRIGVTGEILYYPSPGFYLMEFQATNSCGTSNWIGGEIEFADCTHGGGGGGEEYEAFAVYPNPVDNGVITIVKNSERENQDDEAVTESVFTLELINQAQQIVRRETCGAQRMEMDVSGIENGTYYLIISHGDRKETKRIVVGRE